MGGSQLPDQGLNPPPPASGGEVSTTELPGKSLLLIFYCSRSNFESEWLLYMINKAYICINT